ncbi:MAG: hypothetical protein HC847_09030 [Hydrococcus sp. RU_2_2]|nr:hypothetical protein [Hydrococcus sp. RU_2_2]NJR76378.1 hypothetical protein [Scytonema sp. CRU_2_7]
MADRLRTEQKLGVEESIVSNNGRYQLVLQGDGNLVLYGLKGRVLRGATWASGTDGQVATQVVLQRDGNFVVYGSRGRVPGGATWASGTDGQGGTTLVMQDDGNLVLYRPDGSAVWATDTVEPPAPPPEKAYCCNVARADGSRLWQKTIYASSKGEAIAECERLRFDVGGAGFGLGSGTCSSGELKQPEMILTNISPALEE